MRFPMTVLRVVTLAPALLVSFVLTVVVCALLPPALGLVAFMAAGGVLVALALGQLQEPAIAALTRSRPATEAEFRVMAPVLAELGGRGVDVGALFVRRVQRPSTPVAVAIGRRAVVVSPGLVEATYRGGVTGAEAAAALAHAVGRRRAIRPRLELAVLAATTPWRLVVATFRGVGRAFAWLPFMRLAWTLRGVVGVDLRGAVGRRGPGLGRSARGRGHRADLPGAGGRPADRAPARRPRPTSSCSRSASVPCWRGCCGATGTR